MKKRCLLAILSVTVAVVVGACGSQSNSSDIASDYYDYVGESNGYFEQSMSSDAGMLEDAPMMPETAYEGSVGAYPMEEYEKKIIRNASVSLGAEDAEAAYSQILDYVKSIGGYEFSSNTRKSSYSVTIYSSVRVAPEKLEDVLEYIDGCGDVTSQNISSDDITEAYYDAEIRLENKRRNLDKYYEFLEMAETVEDVIMIQSEIDSITADIEAYEGRLRMWDSLVSESAIDITIQKSVDPISETEDIDWDALSVSDMGKLISNGFKSVVNFLAALLQWMVIILISISPILIIALIIVLIIRAAIKSKKKRRLAKEAATPNGGNTVNDAPENSEK